MKTLLSIICISAINVSLAQTQKTQLQADSVVVYFFKQSIVMKEVEQEGDSVVFVPPIGAIVKDGKLSPITFDQVRRLTKKEAKELEKIINRKTVGDEITEVAFCFDPHHGIVWYRQGKPTRWSTICFECNQHESFALPHLKLKNILAFFHRIGVTAPKKIFTEMTE